MKRGIIWTEPSAMSAGGVAMNAPVLRQDLARSVRLVIFPTREIASQIRVLLERLVKEARDNAGNAETTVKIVTLKRESASSVATETWYWYRRVGAFREVSARLMGIF